MCIRDSYYSFFLRPEEHRLCSVYFDCWTFQQSILNTFFVNLWLNNNNIFWDFPPCGLFLDHFGLLLILPSAVPLLYTASYSYSWLFFIYSYVNFIISNFSLVCFSILLVIILIILDIFILFHGYLAIFCFSHFFFILFYT